MAGSGSWAGVNTALHGIFKLLEIATGGGALTGVCAALPMLLYPKVVSERRGSPSEAGLVPFMTLCVMWGCVAGVVASPLLFLATGSTHIAICVPPVLAMVAAVALARK